jgi:predicted nucleic-acid-binding protein
VIALDTNVVVRIFVDDDPAQRTHAVALVARADTEGAQLFVPDPVLCEFVWVLRTCYRRTRNEIADALDVLAGSRQLRFASPDRVAAAIVRFRGGKGDFADYLIRECAEGEACAAVATFDGTLLGERGFVHPDPQRWDDGLSLHERAPRYRRRPATAPRSPRQPGIGRPAASNASTGTAAAGDASNSSRSIPKTSRSPGPGSAPSDVPRRQPSRR